MLHTSCSSLLALCSVLCSSKGLCQGASIGCRCSELELAIVVAGCDVA